MFFILQALDRFMSEECSDSQAFDLSMAVPFFAGYLTLRLAEWLLNRYSSVLEVKESDRVDDCLEQSNKEGTQSIDINQDLQDLRQEIMKEKQLIMQPKA